MKRTRTTSRWQVAPMKKSRIAGTLYMHSRTNRKVYCDKGLRLQPACIFDDCKKWVGYGYPLDPRATYCATHKQDGMEDIVNKRCLHDGCKTISVYGHSTRTYCATHKQDGMEDIASKQCLHDGCTKGSSYGHATRTYCAAHKQDGMKDFASKQCLHDGCEKVPHYGHSTRMYCVTHKQDGMKNIQ
jgi:hypothetical protein